MDNKSHEGKKSSERPVSIEKIIEEGRNTDAESKESASVPGAVEDKAPQPQYLTGVKLWVIHAALTLVIFLMMLDMSIIVTAIPRITSDFHSLQDVGWYGSAYLLASSALMPLTGKVYTYFSSKYAILSFFAVFELGSVLCGAAVSSKMIIVGRAVAGLGCSGIGNGAITVLTTIAPMHKQPMLMGLMMSFSQLGIISGPLIGGVLTEYASWRWCFYINLPIGAVACLILVLIRIPDRSDKIVNKLPLPAIFSKFDFTGFAFFASSAIMFFLALEWGGVNYPWKSATIIGLFCGAGGALAVFLAWEHHIGDGAMIPLSLFKRRVVSSACLTMFFFTASMFIYSYYLPIYFQAVKGVSPALSGVYVLPGIGSQIIFAGFSGFLVGKMGYYLPASIFSAVLIPISAGLISTLTPHTATPKWVVYQIIGGIGRGCGMQMPLVAIQNSVPPQMIPIGMAMVMFTQTFSGALFLTFAETIFNQFLLSGLKKYAPKVNPQVVISAGAAAIRKVVESGDVEGVLLAYSTAINRDFYLAAGASVGLFVFCWGMGWHKISKKPAPPAKE